MYEKVFEQADSLLKPADEILVSNAKTLDALGEKQRDFLTGMLSDNLDYAQELSKSPGLDTFFESHNAYISSMQKKIESNTREAFALLNSNLNESLAKTIFDFGSAFNPAGATAKSAEKGSEVKPATPRRKPVSKTAAKKATAKKTAEKPTVAKKPAARKKAAEKKEISAQTTLNVDTSNAGTNAVKSEALDKTAENSPAN